MIVKEWKALEPRFMAVIIASLGAALIVVAWLAFFGGSEPFVFFDIDCYRNAVVDVTNGTKSMYDALPYPPFAFLLIWWLPGLPILLGNQIWTAATLLIMLAVVLTLTQMAAKVAHQRTNRPWLATQTSVNVALLLVTLPMLSQLTNGQLSILVMALALIDASGLVPPRFQGVLIGIAGAIKVTPLIFVIYFIVTGQRRQAAVATATFGAATTLAWAIFPQGSFYFWTHLGKNDGFGDPTRIDNLSIHSALARISTHLGEMPVLWLTLGAVVVVASMWHARRRFLRGEVVEAVLVVGSAATVVAPIAWPHYFIWLPLAAIWLIMTGGRQGRFVGFGIIFCFSLPPLVMAIRSSAASTLLVPMILVAVPVLIGLFGLPHRPVTATPTTLPSGDPVPITA